MQITSPGPPAAPSRHTLWESLMYIHVLIYTRYRRCFATSDVTHTDYLVTMQGFAVKRWVLTLMWTPLDAHNPSKLHSGWTTPSWQQHSQMALNPPPTPCTKQDNVPWHTTKTAQERLEEHNKEPKASSQIRIQLGPEGSGSWHHRRPPEVLLYEHALTGQLFWLHEGIQLSTEQVVLMLWLTGVCVCVCVCVCTYSTECARIYSIWWW